MKFNTKWMRITLVAASVGLTACGGAGTETGGTGGTGGGGGGGGTGGGSGAPVANAGGARSVDENTTVILDAGASTDDNAIVTYEWVQISGPTIDDIDNDDEVVASFVAPEVATDDTIIVQLTVTDADGNTDTDTVSIFVNDTTPAARSVIFLADKDNDSVFELYRTDDRAQAAPSRLSAAFTHDQASISEFSVSPDGRWLAYTADAAFEDRIELFVAPADGSAPASRAHLPLGSGESVSEDGFAWAPDSSRLAFVADLDANDPSGDTNTGTFDLYTVVPGSASPVRISNPFQNAKGEVGDLAWAPDSSRIAYVANADQSGTDELYSALPASQGSIKLNSSLVSGGDVLEIAWAPDGGVIAYLADQFVNGKNELFTASPTSTGGTRVSDPMSNDRDVADDFAWAPDGSRLAYRSNDTGANTSVYELYTTTRDGTDGAGGSGVIREHARLTGSSQSVFDFAWSPDGSRIAYRAVQNTSAVEMYVASPGAAPANTVVSGTMTGGGNVNGVYAWSPTGAWIAYVADQASDNVFELWTSSPTGDSNNRVSGTLTSGGDVSRSEDGVAWSPDGSRIAYLADQNQAGSRQLFTSTPDGARFNTVVSGRPTPGGNVTTDFGWNRDGTRIVYRADQDVPGVFELYSASGDSDPATSGDNPNLSGTLATDTGGNTVGDVTEFELEGEPE